MKAKYHLNEQDYEVSPIRQQRDIVLDIAGTECVVSLNADQNPQTITLDGRDHELYVAIDGDNIFIQSDGVQWHLTAIDPIDAVSAGSNAGDIVSAPMPGIVVSLDVAVGDVVSRGQTMLTIESMKLQTAIVADRDGTLAEIGHVETETFEKGAMLVRFENPDS